VDSRIPDLARDIQALLSSKLSISVESIDTELLDSAILDSMTLVQLILALEQEHKVELPLHELEIECFSTVRRIAELVYGRTRAQAAACSKAGPGVAG
jgi:acyl carrier protein